MSLKDCIEAAGGITPEEATEYWQTANPKGLVDQKRADVMRRKELLQMQRLSHEEAMSKIFAHPRGPVTGLRSMITNDLTGNATWSNIEYRTDAIMGQAHAKMANVIQDLSNTMFGLRRGNVALADDVIRQLHGTETGNVKAIELAKQWDEAAEFLRVRFNNAGGDIGKLDTWGMPQSHSQPKVFRAGKDEWLEFVTPRLRNADELDLPKIYETISTGGLNKVGDLPPVAGGRMTANLHQEERILHFKDGDSWLQYNDKFGDTKDPLSIMENHTRGLAMDIANMEIFGPNPEHLFQTLNQEVSHAVETATLAKQRAKMDGKPVPPEVKKNAQGQRDWYNQALFDVVSGKIDQSAAVSVASKTMESFFSTARAMQVATKLGHAVISAITDTGTLFVNTAHHGINPFKMAKTALTNLTPVVGLDKQVQIARLGFALDVFNASITRRFDEVGKTGASVAAEAVMRATGMNRWTEALRKAFQYEFYNHLSNQQAKAVRTGKLPSIYKNYGWDLKEVKGLDFDNLDLNQQTRILEMVNQEGDYAVMMPNARSRAITTGGFQKGTTTGELTRTAMQFKSFPATFMIQQVGRTFMQDNMSFASKAKYGAAMLTATTLLGALAVMAKDKAKGYDKPRKGSPLREGDQKIEDTTAFWRAAILQGGGAGIIGDFLFSDQNRFGGGIIPTLAGPTAGTLEKAVKLTIGNAQQAAEGKDTHFGSEFVDFVNREANPLNLWYTSALMETYVSDNLKILTDPKYKKAKRRKARKRRKEYGQKKGTLLKDLIEFNK